MPKEISMAVTIWKYKNFQTQGRLELQLDFQEKLPMLKGGNFPFS